MGRRCIEIFVTSACGPEKVEYYSGNRLKSIEIDLSRVDPGILPADLVRLVLDEWRNRWVLFWPTEQPAAPVTLKRDWGEIFGPPAAKAGAIILGIGVVVVGLVIWLKGKNGKKGRRKR
jgi:hypothetical protein